MFMLGLFLGLMGFAAGVAGLTLYLIFLATVDRVRWLADPVEVMLLEAPKPLVPVSKEPVADWEAAIREKVCQLFLDIKLLGEGGGQLIGHCFRRQHEEWALVAYPVLGGKKEYHLYTVHLVKEDICPVGHFFICSACQGWEITSRPDGHVQVTIIDEQRVPYAITL